MKAKLDKRSSQALRVEASYDLQRQPLDQEPALPYSTS
jgi:hypothetical protein